MTLLPLRGAERSGQSWVDRSLRTWQPWTTQTLLKLALIPSKQHLNWGKPRSFRVRETATDLWVSAHDQIRRIDRIDWLLICCLSDNTRSHFLVLVDDFLCQTNAKWFSKQKSGKNWEFWSSCEAQSECHRFHFQFAFCLNFSLRKQLLVWKDLIRKRAWFWIPIRLFMSCFERHSTVDLGSLEAHTVQVELMTQSLDFLLWRFEFF